MGRPLDVSASAYERDSAAILRCHHRIAADARFPKRNEVLVLLDDLLPRISTRVVSIARKKVRRRKKAA